MSRHVTGELNATKQELEGSHLVVHGSDNVIHGNDNEARGNGNVMIGHRVLAVGFGSRIIGSGEISGTGSIVHRVPDRVQHRPLRTLVGTDGPPEEGDRPCIACVQHAVRCVSLPCGHAVLCLDCTRRWEHSTCVVCRRSVDAVHLFYL